ncbi:MAG: SIMPL domain-containing protein [Saprospiraceae bacterium]|nr:SIMPL domain-containing protein [Saprospiraceae bacterium]
MKDNRTISSLILGICFVVGMFVFGNAYRTAQRSNQYVSVKGLAEREVKADQGSWIISSGNAGNDLAFLKSSVNTQTEEIKSWLKLKGFSPEEIKVEELSLSQNIYGQAQARYTANLQVSISTDKVDLLDKVSGEVNELIERGVNLTGDRWLTRPRFFFTRINEIKPDLLAESTKAALRSAEEFAANSGARVGDIKIARQGIISLIPSNRVSESEEFYLNKIARVVSSIDYYIE